MKKIYDFLRQYKDLAFATVGIDWKPKIRVFQVMKIDEQGDTLYFATSPRKEVYEQLKTNPSIEMLAMAGDISIRISGDAVFEVSDDIGRGIYDTNPILSRLYTYYSDLAYFSVPIATVDYYDLSTTPPTQEVYNIR